MDLNNLKELTTDVGQFDIVYCSNVLEHIKYPAHVLCLAFRCTKQYFISITPNDKYKFTEIAKRCSNSDSSQSNR